MIIFTALGQGNLAWRGMTTTTEGDVYAAVFNGDIYKRIGGTGNFVALGQTVRNWNYMATAPNGDIYAGLTTSGDIYKQTGGTGNFVALGQTARNWRGIAVASNGDVYTTVFGGSIYKNFVTLGQTSRSWGPIAVAPNGDVYAGVFNGDIYKQTGGVGNFIALGQTSRFWGAFAIASNGDVYATVANSDIYKQTAGVGDFIALGQTQSGWAGITIAPNGDLYANIGTAGDIYQEAKSPTISVQPNSITRAIRDIATFSITASALPSPSYQWYFNGSLMTDGGRISGSTTATLTISNTSANDAGNYSVVVSNEVVPDATSNNVSLTISPETFGNGRGNRVISLDATLSAKFGRSFGQMADYVG